MGVVPALDDKSDPHLRLGEIAVVDKRDREPQHGAEVYVIQCTSGRFIVPRAASFLLLAILKKILEKFHVSGLLSGLRSLAENLQICKLLIKQYRFEVSLYARFH